MPADSHLAKTTTTTTTTQTNRKTVRPTGHPAYGGGEDAVVMTVTRTVVTVT